MIKTLHLVFKSLFLLALLYQPLVSSGQCTFMPMALATPGAQTICSGSPITTIVLSSTIPGTVYNWTRDNTSTVTGIAGSGTGNISGSLINTTNAPVTVNFTITPTSPTQYINESFNTIMPAGWSQNNLSSPLGTGPPSTWFQGNAFPPFSPPSFIAACYNSSTPGGLVSNWLITPVIPLNNGDQLSFYTRTASPAAFPDRLQVRMSANGASSNVGTTSTGVGDFTTLLIDVNPSYSPSGYPTTWTQFSVTISGLAGFGNTGRIAFRYYIIRSTTPGENSAMIGIDDLVYTTAAPCTGTPITATVIVNPSPTVTISSNITPPIIPGQVVTLTANVNPIGGSFAWYKDGNLIFGATGNTLTGITVTELGTYSVVYTDPNGCATTSAGFNVFSKPAPGLFIHPNPNNGDFRITFPNTVNEEATVSVYNSRGAIIYQQKFKTGTSSYSKVEVDLGAVPNNGILMAEIRNAKGVRIGSATVVIAK